MLKYLSVNASCQKRGDSYKKPTHSSSKTKTNWNIETNRIDEKLRHFWEQYKAAQSSMIPEFV